MGCICDFMFTLYNVNSGKVPLAVLNVFVGSILNLHVQCTCALCNFFQTVLSGMATGTSSRLRRELVMQPSNVTTWEPALWPLSDECTCGSVVTCYDFQADKKFIQVQKLCPLDKLNVGEVYTNWYYFEQLLATWRNLK